MNHRLNKSPSAVGAVSSARFTSQVGGGSAFFVEMATMKAPKYIAVFACLFFAFAIVQGFMWHWVPESDWQPNWWQLHSLATLGFIMRMPALLPMETLQIIGVRSFAVCELTMIGGFVVEFVLIYALVYFPTKYLFKALYGRRTSKPVT